MNAESKLKEVTTMGYQLLANYEDLFDYTKSEHHSEYIFDIEYQPVLERVVLLRLRSFLISVR